MPARAKGELNLTTATIFTNLFIIRKCAGIFLVGLRLSCYNFFIMELLAPAGNLEKLKTAVRFGADAVYCGAGNYSLRTFDTSFSLEDLKEGVRFAHEHGCKVYLAMNIFAFDNDLDKMITYFQEAEKSGIDAVIVSDPGVVYRLNMLGTNTKIHLSTQANTMNSDSVRFWKNQGVKRIVLARELSLAQIAAIKKQVPDMELEIFVHGAMCIAYSGRCLLSKYMTGRSANRGDCAQPCRWEYQLKESLRTEEQTICEDEKGTYILNSRDLCLIEHLPTIASSGISSLKIEGRMKSAYYVAAVTRIYRQALDSFLADAQNYVFRPEWLSELTKVSHRPYTTGFYLPGPGNETEYPAESAYIRGYDFVGTIENHDPAKKTLKVLGRNRFVLGDTLEIIDPHQTTVRQFKVTKILHESGEYLEAAHNGYLVTIPLEENIEQISKHSILRKERS